MKKEEVKILKYYDTEFGIVQTLEFYKEHPSTQEKGEFFKCQQIEGLRHLHYLKPEQLTPGPEGYQPPRNGKQYAWKYTN